MFDWQCLRIRIWAMNSRNSLAFIIIVNTKKLDERKYSNVCSIFHLVDTCIFWWQKKVLFMFFFPVNVLQQENALYVIQAYAYSCILCLLNIVFIGAVDTELNHTEGEQDNKMELSYIEKVNKQ